MPDNDQYKTIAKASEGVYREKASKFISLAFPVSSQDEAMEVLGRVRKQYFDASHHCFAYRLGTDGSVFRYSDDREPSGTAGRPIHGEIISAGLTSIIIIVVRYFGGTKLGTGGLIHAYKEAARDALAKATVVIKFQEARVKIEFDYEHINDVMKILKEEGGNILSQNIDNLSVVIFKIRASSVARIVGRLQPYCNVVMPDN